MSVRPVLLRLSRSIRPRFSTLALVLGMVAASGPRVDAALVDLTLDMILPSTTIPEGGTVVLVFTVKNNDHDAITGVTTASGGRNLSGDPSDTIIGHITTNLPGVLNPGQSAQFAVTLLTPAADSPQEMDEGISLYGVDVGYFINGITMEQHTATISTQITVTDSSTPEPSSIVLLGLGASSVLGYARFRRRRSKVG